MVTRSHGPQQKTRNKLKKKPRNKGKISISKFFQRFKEGDKVLIKAEPSFKKNIPHRRFMNKYGIILGKQGNAYRVQIKDMNKNKEIYVFPIHLKRLIKV